MKKSNSAGRRLPIILFIGFMIILITSLTFMGYFFFNVYVNTISFDTLSDINREATAHAEAIDNFLQNVQGDVLFLSELSSLRDLINSNDEELKNKAKTNLAKDFLSFSNEKKVYYQIRYIDEDGQEIVRVDSQEGDSKIVYNNLQNKKERYYFIETMNHQLGEVFISPLDLNIEHNGVENRGTVEEPFYVPVIRYATPVFDNERNPKGIIITNIYAQHFLEGVQEKQKSGEVIFLLDNNGYYLSHPLPEKEFGFMFGDDETIYNDYPEIAPKLLSNEENEILELGDLLVSFRYIYPRREIIGGHESGGSREIDDMHIKNLIKLENEDYFWVLVGIVSKEEILSRSDNVGNEFLLIVISTIGIVGILFLFLFFLMSRRIRIIIKNPKKGGRQ
jgi:methyl-accepting chemotaxis protein